MLDELSGFGIRQTIELFKSLLNVAVTEFVHRAVDGSMALETRPRLFDRDLPLRIRLVVEHVGVASILTKIPGECIAGPNGFQPRVRVELRLSDDRPRIRAGRCVRNRFAPAVACSHLIDRAPIRVVLKRKILAPDRRIIGLVIQLRDSEEHLFGFFLALKDLDQEGGDQEGHDCGGEHCHDQPA